MSSKKNNPIGVFDSGLGGLTVVHELQRLLPHEDIIYLGDSARLPYGTKSKKQIIQFSLENAAFLLKKKVKALVIACNSSSAKKDSIDPVLHRLILVDSCQSSISSPDD